MGKEGEEENVLLQLNLRKAYLQVFGTIHGHLPWNPIWKTQMKVSGGTTNRNISHVTCVKTLSRAGYTRARASRTSGPWAALPHLHADTALQLELQPDHVHLLHGAQLVKLGDFLGHLIYRHFNRVQLCARLADDLDSLLHVGKHVTGWRRAKGRCWTAEGECRGQVPLRVPPCISHGTSRPACFCVCALSGALWAGALTPLSFCPSLLHPPSSLTPRSPRPCSQGWSQTLI